MTHRSVSLSPRQQRQQRQRPKSWSGLPPRDVPGGSAGELRKRLRDETGTKGGALTALVRAHMTGDAASAARLLGAAWLQERFSNGMVPVAGRLNAAGSAGTLKLQKAPKVRSKDGLTRSELEEALLRAQQELAELKRQRSETSLSPETLSPPPLEG